MDVVLRRGVEVAAWRRVGRVGLGGRGRRVGRGGRRVRRRTSSGAGRASWGPGRATPSRSAWSARGRVLGQRRRRAGDAGAPTTSAITAAPRQHASGRPSARRSLSLWTSARHSQAPGRAPAARPTCHDRRRRRRLGHPSAEIPPVRAMYVPIHRTAPVQLRRPQAARRSLAGGRDGLDGGAEGASGSRVRGVGRGLCQLGAPRRSGHGRGGAARAAERRHGAHAAGRRPAAGAPRDRQRAGVDTIDVACWTAGARRGAARLAVDDHVEVAGCAAAAVLPRRWSRWPAATRSRRSGCAVRRRAEREHARRRHGLRTASSSICCSRADLRGLGGGDGAGQGPHLGGARLGHRGLRHRDPTVVVGDHQAQEDPLGLDARRPPGARRAARGGHARAWRRPRRRGPRRAHPRPRPSAARLPVWSRPHCTSQPYIWPACCCWLVMMS